MLRKILCFLFCLSALSAEIFKLDEEDLRNFLLTDRMQLLTLPPKYAFSQAAQYAHEYGYRYFALISYECCFGDYLTHARFPLPDQTGVLLDYQDDWIHIELFAYFDPSEDPNIFDSNQYIFCLWDQKIDLSQEEE